MLTGRRCGGCPGPSTSSTRMLPSVGSSKPPIMRRSVVLPQPEGPRREKNSPLRIAKETPSTATKPPKRLLTPWISTLGSLTESTTPAGVCCWAGPASSSNIASFLSHGPRKAGDRVRADARGVLEARVETDASRDAGSGKDERARPASEVFEHVAEGGVASVGEVEHVQVDTAASHRAAQPQVDDPDVVERHLFAIVEEAARDPAGAQVAAPACPEIGLQPQ